MFDQNMPQIATKNEKAIFVYVGRCRRCRAIIENVADTTNLSNDRGPVASRVGGMIQKGAIVERVLLAEIVGDHWGCECIEQSQEI